MGVGTIVATGIFSFLPFIYTFITGPAVVLSLVFAAGTAALSAVCYSEFACEFPVTGGGFFYTLLVFGELPAVLCAVNLLLDYVFGTAAVIRNLSAYFSILFVKGGHTRHCGDVLKYSVGTSTEAVPYPSKWAGHCNMFQYAPLHPSFFARSGVVDYVAAVGTIVLGCVCAYSVKVFDHSNIGMQVLHIGLVCVTFIAAFSNKNSTGDNFHPFFPVSDYDYTAHTKAIGGTPSTLIVAGAANIFFVFIGYDVIALGAEESRHPSSLPIGTLAAIAVVTVLYILMACSLVMLIPWEVLANQPGDTVVTAFAYAFELNGMHWARYIVALGAVIGICTSTAIGLYGMARIFQVFARERLFPPWVGHVNARTGTPIYATALSTLIVMCFAFFSDFATLANLTSIGTLLMFWFVALAQVYRRYAPGLADEMGVEAGKRHLHVPFRFDPAASLSQGHKRYLVGFWMFLIVAAPIVFTVFFNGGDSGIYGQQFSFNLGGFNDAGKLYVSPTWWTGLGDRTRTNGMMAMVIVWGVGTLGLQLTCPMEFVPEKWHIPFWLMPWLPACSIFSLTLLVGSFGGLELDYSRLGYSVVAITGIYLFYGVHASYHRFMTADAAKAEGAIELGSVHKPEAAAEEVAAPASPGGDELLETRHI